MKEPGGDMTKDQDPRREPPSPGEEPVWLWVKAGVWIASLLAIAGAAWVLSTVRVRIDLPPMPEMVQSETLSSYTVPPEEPSPAPAPYMSEEGRAITNPAWLQAPQPAFPRAAQRAGEESGAVRLECQVAVDGRVRACRIAEEAPAGVGFGEQAVKATLKARVRPRLEDGEPTESQIAFTIRYQLD
ncbi:Gram-negative bacterial tonB protein [compost metagenome]